MKLLKLEILNLASLDKKDGEVINFEEGALGETSIFSIVGPTGSGKSTLLDAICLALYNRAPRYPRKKGDRNQNIEIYGTQDETEKNRLAPTDGRNILTRGKKDGYSKLTFLANNCKIYRAEWHVHFSVKKYSEQEMFLFELLKTATGFDEKRCEWATLPQIIGLDYEQFLRTVLIAQGSFANFLTAKENERYELLEKLIGCEEMYTSIAQKIKERKDDAQRMFDAINADVAALQQYVIADEEHISLQEEYKALEEAEKKINEQILVIDSAIKWYDDELQLQKTLSNHNVEEEKARLALEAIKESVERLSLHDALLPATDILREVKRLEKSISDASISITKIEKEISAQKETIVAAESQKKNLEEKAQQAQTAIEAAAPHIAKARQLRTLIEPAKKAFNEKKVAKDNATTEKQNADKAVVVNQEQIKAAEKTKDEAVKKVEETKAEIDAKKKKLAEAEAVAINNLDTERKKTEGQSAETLQQQKDKASQDVLDLNTAIEIVDCIQKNKEEIKASGELQQKLNEENVAAANEQKSLSEEIEKLDKDEKGLRKAYTLMTSENWIKHRADLEEGKVCPLCGSKHHPFSNADSQELDDATIALKKSLDEKVDLLEKKRHEEKSLTALLNKNKGELEGIAKSLKKAVEELRVYEQKWSDISDKHNDWTLNKEALTAMVDGFQKTKAEAESVLSTFNKVQKDIERLSGIKDKATKAKIDYEISSAKQIEAANKALSDADARLQTLKGQTENLLAQQKDKEEALTKANEAYLSAEKELKELQRQYQAELGGKDPEAEEKRLSDAKKSADEAVTKKAEEIAKLQKALGELSGKLSQQQTQTKQDDTVKADKQKELDSWIENYNTNAQSAVSLDVVSEMLSATDNWEAIRKDKKSKDDALISASTLRKNAEQQILEHQKSKPAKTEEELAAEKESLSNNSQKQKLIEIGTRLNNHANALKQMGDKAEDLRLATENNDDWRAISEAIGGDGKTLRKIAQCYTLRFLIEHANDEIRKFNTRYELQQVKNSLGIRVIDHDRADDIRDTTSLSGGETFIVSLGLALGLSSLSSRNISFENLFIDEGFGTLDPDTLDSVIDSLAMLQTSQGKKVGVISHTDTMSERIATQIRVIKNGNSGNSHIEIYPHN